MKAKHYDARPYDPFQHKLTEAINFKQRKHRKDTKVMITGHKELWSDEKEGKRE